MTTVSVVACLGFLRAAPGFWGVVIVLCLAAFAYGGYLALMPAFCADYFGQSHIGGNYGLLFSAWGICGFVMPLYSESMLDRAREAGNLAGGYKDLVSATGDSRGAGGCSRHDSAPARKKDCMKLHRSFATALIVLTPLPALPQALPNLGLARLNYNVRKRVVKPQGELKTKIDANDRDLGEATRLGQVGEVRRLIAKGQVLLAGKEWTQELDFASSLAVRADTQFADPAKPYTIRIQRQIYRPSIQLESNLTAKVSLRTPRVGQTGGDLVKDLGSFDDLPRDFAESPGLLDLDLASVADGNYQVQVEVFDGSKSLGTASMRMMTLKGLDASVSRIEAAAKSAPDSVRADALYPIDHMRVVNHGLMDLGQFDLAKEFAVSEQVLTAAKGGKDPFAAKTGDFKRHYALKAANEIMPYRLYVPPAYNSSRAWPLVVALHGLGGTEDSMFGAAYKVSEQAARLGYIAAASWLAIGSTAVTDAAIRSARS